MANITTQTIRVDLNTGKSVPTAFVHQNDTARTLVFSMYLNGMPYTMTGHTVKFAYQSPIVNGQYTVITGNSMATGTVSGFLHHKSDIYRPNSATGRCDNHGEHSNSAYLRIRNRERDRNSAAADRTTCHARSGNNRILPIHNR